MTREVRQWMVSGTLVLLGVVVFWPLAGVQAQTVDCLPTSDHKACRPTQCLVAGDECIPRCMRFDPATGQTWVESCDCRKVEECHVVSQVLGACVVPDNGSGTADLPPVGCMYLSPSGDMHIVDGLPPGTEIAIDSFFDVFFDISRTPGGPLGGEVEVYKSILHLPMTGTGSLGGYSRNLQMVVQCQAHAGPRSPGDPVQSFDTDMFLMQGQLPPGDPDFDLLRVTAGTGLGLPSPGHTTLTRLPGGDWHVDSFFDITYRIDFVGAPGGPLGGMSGSTTGTIRIQSGTPAPQPDCVGICPPGAICEKTVTTNPNGTLTICCDCRDQPQECRPAPDGQSCVGTCPDLTKKCEPVAWGIDAVGQFVITECDCRGVEDCQLHLIPGALPFCNGLCPDGTPNCKAYPNSSGGFRCDCLCQTDQDCDDGDACTIDICDPATGACLHFPVSCDDGDPCTLDTCDPATGCVHTPVDCDDNNSCTDDRCDPATGLCVHTPVNCDDGDPCTKDSCDPAFGCIHVPVNCNDGDPCTIDLCDPAAGGCVHIPVNCDDANACTIDQCDPATGSCIYTLVNCDDGDPCTADSCNPVLGCIHTPIPGCGQVPKWRQPPSPEREDVASNVWITPNGPQQPNVVVADDFRSDGRPITSVRWWGSYLNQEYVPAEFGGFGQPPYAIDGWFISFHRPIVHQAAGAPPHPPLGLYFAPARAVKIAPVPTLFPCDGHPVFEYVVEISQCCLIESWPDIRLPVTHPHRCPAQPEAFYEHRCFWYNLDIQAVVGTTYEHTPGSICCDPIPTPNIALGNFWGWHATANEAGKRPAVQSKLTRGTALVTGPCPPLSQCPPHLPWLYGPWVLAKEVCPFPHRINMAFELWTNVLQVPPPCPPLILTGAVSIKDHATTPPSPLPIVLPLDPPSGAASESRAGGPTRLVLSFSEDIVADDGSLDPGDEALINVGTMTGLSVVGNQLTIDLTGVPNAACLHVMVENTTDGITTIGGEPLDGDSDVHVRALRGDASNDGAVNTSDYVSVRGRMGQAASSTNARFDVDRSGAINTSDYVAIRGFIGTGTSCP